MKWYCKIALFLAIVVGLDVSFGYVCKYMASHPKGGTTGNLYYICKESSEDVLLFGSSRMHHHYVPEMFSDSLGLSCYNAGIDGNGAIMTYGFLRMVTARYVPSVIVYDLSAFDMYTDDNAKYINYLKDFYSDPGIDSIIWSVSPSEKYKLVSSFYRYNNKALRFAGDFVHPMKSLPQGYAPLYGVMSEEMAAAWVPESGSSSETGSASVAVDSLKLHYLRKFIELCKSRGIRLIFSASPSYTPSFSVSASGSSSSAISGSRAAASSDSNPGSGVYSSSCHVFGSDSASVSANYVLLTSTSAETAKFYEPALRLCSEYGNPFFDFTLIPGISDNRLMFQDYSHLNDTGARAFTAIFLHHLKASAIVSQEVTRK